MKLSYVTGIALLLSLVWACQQDLARRGPAIEGVVFACATRCEDNKIYTTQGQCPVCHIHLAALHGVPANSNEFEMRAVVRPTVPQAERPVELALRPTRVSQEDARVRLSGLDGQGRVHVMLVSEDLGWFDYLATDDEEKGVYRIDAHFPGGGSYFLFTEYQPNGAGNLVDRLNINVTGAMFARRFVMAGENLASETNHGYQVELLTAEGELHAETLEQMTFEVRQGKKMVTEFGEYLGTRGHLFLVRADGSGYAHLRAEATNDGRLSFEAPIGSAGTYRAFLQFQSGGQTHKATFTLKVEESEPAKRYTVSR